MSNKLNSPKLLFGGGLLAGLVIGVVIGATIHLGGAPGGSAPIQSPEVAANYAENFKKLDDATLWTPYALNWQSTKPPYAVIGQAPLTVATPTAAYDYGGVTRALTPDEIKADTIIRVDFTGVKNQLGLSLVNPQGSPLVTQEKFVTSADNGRSAFFLVRSKDLPAAVLVRNGTTTTSEPGSITIKAVYYTPAAKFSADQLAALTAVGLNKPLLP